MAKSWLDVQVDLELARLQPGGVDLFKGYEDATENTLEQVNGSSEQIGAPDSWPLQVLHQQPSNLRALLQKLHSRWNSVHVLYFWSNSLFCLLHNTSKGLVIQWYRAWTCESSLQGAAKTNWGDVLHPRLIGGTDAILITEMILNAWKNFYLDFNMIKYVLSIGTLERGSHGSLATIMNFPFYDHYSFLFNMLSILSSALIFCIVIHVSCLEFPLFGFCMHVSKLHVGLMVNALLAVASNWPSVTDRSF